jgi:hypothetical protein
LKSNSDNVPTGEQHKGRQRSDSAEPDSGGIPKSNILHKAMQEWLLEKTIFNVRQKGVPPLLLPASVLQLPRCLTRIYNLDSYHSTLFELASFKKCNCSRENLLQIQFAPQMWATRPHLGSIFEKLLHRKTFYFACGSYVAAIPL